MMMVVMTVMMTRRRKRMTRMVMMTNTSQGPGVMAGTCHGRFLNLSKSRKGSHYTASKRQDWDSSRGRASLSSLPQSHGTRLLTYFGFTAVLRQWKCMSPFTCGFQQLQKSSCLRRTQLLMTQWEVRILDHAPHPRRGPLSFVSLSSRARENCVTVLLTQLFNTSTQEENVSQTCSLHSPRVS